MEDKVLLGGWVQRLQPGMGMKEKTGPSFLSQYCYYTPSHLINSVPDIVGQEGRGSRKVSAVCVFLFFWVGDGGAIPSTRPAAGQAESSLPVPSLKYL